MFSNAKKLFSLSGFDIKLDPSWLLIAALITWSLSQQYFPLVLPDASPSTHLVMAVVAMLSFFASLVLHELAHSLVARRMGLPIGGITLYLFGGVAELEAEPTSPQVEFWVAVAGPAMSLCLALWFWFTSLLPVLPRGLSEVLGYLAAVNLILALFNMVPAFPLDGGRVMRAWLWYRTGDLLRATRTASRMGTFFGYTLIALGVLTLFQGGLAAGLWQILLGGFLTVAARASYDHQLAQVAFRHRAVRDLMQPDVISVEPEATLAEFVNAVVLRHGISFAPVIEDGLLLGHMDCRMLAEIDRENWTSTRVGDVFAGLDEAATVAPALPVSDLLDEITTSGRRKFLVVEDHRLLGVVTLSDLVRHLRVADMTVQG